MTHDRHREPPRRPPGRGGRTADDRHASAGAPVVERGASGSAQRVALRAAVDYCLEALLVTDRLGAVLAWNEPYAALWDIPRAALEGAEHIQLLGLIGRHFDDPPAFLRRVEEIYETAPLETLDVLVLKDGRVIERASRIWTVGGRNAGRLWRFRDTTALRRAEAALRESDRHNEALLATVAQELRKPLGPILQAAVIAQSPTATLDEQKWSHDVIVRQVTQISVLLDNLLDAAQIARGTLEIHKQPTELASIVRDAVEAARPTIDAKRQKLNVSLPSTPVRLSADPVRLSQALAQLLTNAAKYSYFDAAIELSARTEGAEVVIAVNDHGIGISDEQLPKIFRMFGSRGLGKDPGGGLGIGLALVKRVVELHAGSITASSDGPGRGSEFALRLPRGVLHAGDAPRKVLVADDNPDVVETLAMLLRMEGHDVAVAHDGLQAFETFGRFRPDVALLDIGMPRMNGYEVARRVRESDVGRRVKLVAVTGWGQERDRERAKQAGFDRHFTKPLDPRTLRDLMREA